MQDRPQFAMMLKSYAGDIEYARRLVASFTAYNIERIPLYIVVPPGDVSTFRSLISDDITVLDESIFAEYLTQSDINGYRAGYINQEIVKLAFWEAGLCSNYLVLDSDAVFLREFSTTDFMFDDVTPYTFLTEDAELHSEPQYYEQYWVERKQMIMKIPELMGFEPRLFLTSHNHSVFSETVLRSFKEEFLRPRGWHYLDAIREVPFEFSWYNMWLQAREPIPMRQREPIVKMYHNEVQHLLDVLKGVTGQALARGYVIAVVNSNFSRGIGVVGVEATKHESLANYVTYADLVRVLRVKLVRAINSRVRKRKMTQCP